ncbi:DUF5615 family PIN-like protein [Cyclobacterium salsum]|uniref:DUF5615 family PIN-like protein n=1 Tax=Cyclobacterium salsum TaxID=2666329 RepID=UPI0013907FD6|nr:DUF5615 family PIN-like protein [Cyclobacterium salsum]
MRFRCDVHISFKLVNHLRSLAFEAIHVNQILDKWFTQDEAICHYADENDLIVLTKDIDFRNSFLVRNTPKELVRIKLGNLSNANLIMVMTEYLPTLQKLNSDGGFMMEIDQTSATVIKTPHSPEGKQ